MPILDRDWSSETRSKSEELVEVEMRRREMRNIGIGNTPKNFSNEEK